MGKPKPRTKQNVQFTATIGDLCFYQRNGKTYMREAKALERDMVLTDERFEKTRQYANKMGMASKIASEIYKQLPQEVKARWIFRSIAGHAASLLYQGESPEVVKETLHTKYIFVPQSKLEDDDNSYRTSEYYYRDKANKKLKDLFQERWKATNKINIDFSLAWKEPRAYNADQRKHFNHLYDFLIERFNSLPEIRIESDLGKTFTTKQLHKLLSS
jgi:hypothetical protein